VDKGIPVVITDGLAKRLTSYQAILSNKNLAILKDGGSPKALLKLTPDEIKPVRDKLLGPMQIKFEAPNRVELYLFGDDYFAVVNINDEAVDVSLDLPHVSTFRKAVVLPDEAENAVLSQTGNSVNMRLSPRTLVAVEYQ
jgi:hypothetical protein